MWDELREVRQDSLAIALTNELASFLREQEIDPGIYVGWDPARKNDRSALVILEKELPSQKNPIPKLQCRMLRDLSLDENKMKGVGFLKQADRIIALDKRKRITKLVVDATSNQDAIWDYLNRYFGSRVEPVQFTKQLKEQWIQATRIAFQEQLLEFNPKQSYYKILRTELYELDPTTLKHPDKGTDDFAWSLSLAIKATDMINYKRSVDSGYSQEELIF